MDAAEVGKVKAVWRFPVKAMGGEPVQAADVDAGGCAGDRAYALIDTQTGEVIRGKHAIGLRVIECRASYVAPPVLSGEQPPVEISLPDGTCTRSDAPDGHAVLSRHLGHPVRLVQLAAEAEAIERYRVDTEGIRAPFLQEAALPVAAPMPAFFDLLPMTVVTTSTLQRLGEARPESRFDERRFRMNVIVDTTSTGFVENGWVRSELQLGEHARLRIELPAVRCVVTTFAQGDLAKDPEVLKTVGQHNRLRVAGKDYPCVGAFASVSGAGTMKVGDAVRLRSSPR